jgi:hypothetical protein
VERGGASEDLKKKIEKIFSILVVTVGTKEGEGGGGIKTK